MVEEKAKLTAKIVAKEALENPEGTLVEDGELLREEEEYYDEEYFKDLQEKTMEQLTNECKENLRAS